MMIKLVLTILFLKMSFQENINQIYSPKYLNQLNLTDSWMPLSIAVSNQNNLLFVSSGFDGIQIIDKFGSKILHSFNISDNNYVFNFQITQDGQNLFIVGNSTLNVYQINYNMLSQQEVNIKEIYLCQQFNLSQIILSVSFYEDLQILFVTGDKGQILAYDTTNKCKLYQMGSYSIKNANILQLSISKDFTWLFVSAYLNGLLILKLEITNLITQNNIRELKFLLAGQGIVGEQATKCLATSDFFVYCYDVWTGLFYADFSSLFKLSENQYPLNAKFKIYSPQEQLILIFFDLIMNQEETLLIGGVRSQGVFLLDIKKREQIKLYQFIGSFTDIASINLSSDQNFLYVTSVSSFYTFYQVQVNLNDNYPNLFNIHQSTYYQLDSFLYRTCLIDSKDQYLYGAFTSQGMYVFPFYKNPNKLNITNFNHLDIKTYSIQFDTSERYIIVPQFHKGINLSVYQISPLNNSPHEQEISPMNMKEIISYPYDNSYYSIDFIFNLNKTFAVQAIQYGVIIYNTTDILNMQVLSQWKTPDFIKADITRVCITFDSRWIIAIANQLGFFLINIQNKINPKLENYQLNYCTQNVLASQYYNYIYMIDGTKGFSILDTSFFPSIKIISTIRLQGSAVFGLLLNNEDYIIITQNDKGTMTLINIQDKFFPSIVSEANYLSQNAAGICMCKTMNQIFVVITNGILTMPYKSEIQIHTAVFKIQQISQSQFTKTYYQQTSFDGSKNSPKVKNEYIFQVGQTIELNFNIIYPANLNMKITKIYFYQNQIQSEIPSFFSFQFQEQSLKIQVDKSIGSSNLNIPQQNMILIKTQIPLDSTSFAYSTEDLNDLAIINLQQSSVIFQYLQSQNIIDSNGSVSESYDFYKKLELESQLVSQISNLQSNKKNLSKQEIEQITQKISLTLKKSFYINPFRFYVISSLKFDNQNIFKFITTNSLNQIELILQINNKDGQLIQKSQDSVIFSASQSKDQLKMYGSLDNINRVLQQKIIFSNKTVVSENNSPFIKITINDDSNFPLTFSQSIFESNFIILKDQIKLNKQLSLQSQLEKQYQDGIIFIESDIAISFSIHTFYIKDTQQLTYDAYYLDESGKYALIPPSLWIQQMNKEKMDFKGTTTAALYRQKFQFKIIATDGHSTSEDFFVLEVNGVPFTYTLNMILKVLGPIIAVFGLYQKRFSFYNVIFKKYVTFSDEEAICGKPFEKRLIIIGEEYEDSIFIVKNLISFVNNQSKLTPLTLKNQIFIQDIQIDETENLKDGDLKIKENQNLVLQSTINNNYILKIKKDLQTQREQSNFTEMERRYLDKQGSLVFSQVIQDIIDFKIKPKRQKQKSESQFLEEISDPNQLLQRILRAIISRYLLRMDKRSQIIYELIKKYCIQNLQHNVNDWYKSIAQVTISQDQKNQGHEFFPLIKLKYHVLQCILENFSILDKQQKIPKNIDEFNQLINKNNLKFNLFLIKEVIIADTLGFPEKKPTRFQPCQGQSIHINSEQISQIIAYKKRKLFSFLRPLYRFFNIEYTKSGFSKNMRLPSWLNFNQKRNVITLHGTPKICDIEEILIKIFDKSGYVINQFILKVVYENQTQNLELLKRKIDEVYNETEEFSAIQQPLHNKMNEQMKCQHIRSPQLSFLKNSCFLSENLQDLSNRKMQPQSPLLINYNSCQNSPLKDGILDTQTDSIFDTEDQFKDIKQIHLNSLVTNNNNLGILDSSRKWNRFKLNNYDVIEKIKENI